MGESNLLLADTAGIIGIAILLVMLISGVVGLWFVSRVAPKGTVLAIAIGSYVVSYLIPPGNVAILHGLVGFTRLFGVIGGVLGIIDLIKKRTPTQGDDAPLDAEMVAPPPQPPPPQPPPTPPQIQCPKCQKKFKYRPELAGKTVKCPCGESFSVPGLSRAVS